MKTMKKYILMAVAGMLALSSCSNGDDEPVAQDAPRQMTFSAGYTEGAQTRATLSGKAVSFDAGDKISILSANNTTAKEFTTSAGGATATFTGSAKADTKFYGVYPYNAGLTLDSSTGVISGINIPIDQSGAATSACGWDPRAPIAYATTEGTELKFHNACALLKVTQDRDGDAFIQFWVTNGKMTGPFKLNTSNGSLEPQTGSQYYVSAYNVPKGKTIYIAIAAGTLDHLYANCLIDNNYQINKSGYVTFEAGKIYDMGKTSEWPAL